MKKIILSVVSSLLIFAGTADAAIVEAELIGTVDGGVYDGVMGSGVVTWDDSVTPDPYFTPANGLLTVAFTIFNQAFTAADDADFPNGPELEIFAGEANALLFIVDELEGNNTTEINQPGISNFVMLDVFETSGQGGARVFNAFIEVNVPSAVPLPAALPMAIAGLGLLRIFGGRKRSHG